MGEEEEQVGETWMKQNMCPEIKQAGNYLRLWCSLACTEESLQIKAHYASRKFVATSSREVVGSFYWWKRQEAVWLFLQAQVMKSACL